MISFRTSIRIERPIGEVFAFVADPLLLSRWNSAVELSGIAAALGPLAAHGVRRGVDANLATLKHTLEMSAGAGQVNSASAWPSR
jgi:hypothetical protein